MLKLARTKDHKAIRRLIGGKSRRHMQLEALEHRLVLASTVVFNEIMYNPPGDTDARLEWIELHNQLTVNMDLSEWRLEGGVEYEFPDGTIVPGRGYVVVAADPMALAEETGFTQALGPFTGQLNNGGEEIRLFNNDQRRMNVIKFNDGGDWPVAPDGSGATLAKFDERTSSDDAENWTFSPQIGGTPGARNFILPGTLTSTELLPAGANVRALVPLSPTLGDAWIDPAYDDSAWTTGTTGVGFDNGRTATYDEYLGLDLDAPPDGQSPIPLQNVNQSVYVRVPFQWNTDLAQFETVNLEMQYDDGFVAYLNGVEIAHANAPGRDGNTAPLTWFSGATGSHRDSDAEKFAKFNIDEHRGLFVQGLNVLAIHGLNSRPSDDDFLITPKIVGVAEVKPESGTTLAINEVTAADASDFWFEIANDGDEPVDLGGYVVATADAAGEYTLPPQMLPAGGLAVVNEQALGFRPADGDRLFLLSAGKDRLIDARPVTGRLRGRSDRYDDRWLYPDMATPGAANTFQFNDDVVINEIMYHAFPAQLPAFAIPPTNERTTILAMDASGWRFRESAAPLPSDWASVSHVVDGSQWRSGQGPLGFSPQNFADQLNTELNFPALNVPPFITYYFEHDFEFSGSDKPFGFELNHFIQGGAVFYMNGVEFQRFNLPDGEITADTPALTELRTRNVGVSDRIEIPSDLVVEGTNRLSVEVHRPSLQAIDVVFGAQVRIREEVVPRIPPVPYIESNEEWIELYNRGISQVDLSGWTLRDAVGFEFAPGTTLAPGGYLVVAGDAEALSAKYPTIDIAGEFNGGLSHHDARIQLLDANRNPADEVHYYDSGRWPEFADAGGSSLELVNPNADNSIAESWAASDVSSKSEWHTFTFRELSQPDLLQPNRAQFDELIFGLLDNGEFLIDDVAVVQDPDGAAVQVIQNGTFEGDTIGEEADKWRIIGTHQGIVVADPDDPNNKVLHVTASGTHQYTHDHGETTFANDIKIQDGVDYEFSFRAKWLGGSAQLNTRLFFTRASHTTRFIVPQNSGTPGAVNSTFQTNVGPTYAGFGHSPVMPLESESVTVSVQAQDPDGVASTTLWWRVGADWNSVPMAAGVDGVYTASIPPHAAGDMIQFYVEGTDTLGATSTFPAAGADSRALYQVEDGQGDRKPNNAIDTLRLIFLPEEAAILFPGSTVSNQMSNRLVPFTLVHNNTVFYDVEVRQNGSRFTRPNSGYKIQLGADQAFYGVHDSIRIDLDRHSEMVIKQMINRAGGTKSSAYDDISYLISPRSGHTHEIHLQLSRYEADYLDEQFVNGTDGTKFELDDVVFPTSPRGGPEGPKTGTGTDENNDIGVNTANVAKQGDNPEFYRGHLLIKNQRAKDDYGSIVRLAKAIHLDGDELYAATQEVMDVDLWMREYAIRAFVGDWDTYGFRRPKNLRIYVRPEDGKLIPLFWDADQANFTETIYNLREPSSRLDEIRDLPQNLRLFWGHMLDLINRSFNPEYAASWVDNYGDLTGGAVNNGVSWSQFVGLVERRVTAALEDMQTGRGGIPKVDFEITTNGGQDLQVGESFATIGGTGWVDVREIFVKGSSEPLDVRWIDADEWEVQIPLAQGANAITLQAIDYQGNLISEDAITVTTTAANPVVDSLRITEINYNPYPPTDAELATNSGLNNDDFEFIEVQNVGSQPINLMGAEFTDGVDFKFPLAVLGAGEYGVVAKNMDAFRLRYGTGANVLGVFSSGGLNNNGERLRLVDGLDQPVMEVEYGDSGLWLSRADGLGATLQLVNPAGTAADRLGKYYSWTASTEVGGSPGRAGANPVGVVINEVLTNTDDPMTRTDSIELYNTTSSAIDVGGWFLSDSSDNPLKFKIPDGTSVVAGGYVVFDESDFNPAGGSNGFALSGSRGEDVWLVVPNDQGGIESFVDEVHFGAAESGRSFGRWPNGSGRLAPMTTLTLGAANSAPRVGGVVINEVHYNPGAPSAAALAVDAELTSGDLEYVEILNTTSSTVDLTNWRIRGGIDYDFDTGRTIRPGDVLTILSFDPNVSDNAQRGNAFRTHFGIDTGMMLVGGYQGQLSNSGERIELQRPGEPPADDGSFIPRIQVDEVIYDNLAPWPTEAAGAGQSLTRADVTGWGSSASSWVAATPTPGKTESVGFVPQPGDSNGDREFNQRDIVLVLQAGKYLTGQPATFSEGDWNNDGVFDQLDIVAALQTGNYLQGPYAVKASAAGDRVATSHVSQSPEDDHAEAVDELFAAEVDFRLI